MIDFSEYRVRERDIITLYFTDMIDFRFKWTKAEPLGITKVHLTNYDQFLILWLRERERNISSFGKCCLRIPKAIFNRYANFLPLGSFF